ncbi:GH1 family beta-glucosidase [Kribbella sp. VKM Ac-2568]|uniref:GH1 family beta-glucosidase n=1 Tax=Kribbella sp. VKM Ac-2568 TaxID=2512219 RepID=UPI0010463915|nr:GH1 family beta-glucosidase [Kribbella sp. VKM Ac-2568]TCM42646.1 beta-glucosidase [Kribbella sp. VKM Ac-2568]
MTNFPDGFVWGAATASYQVEGAVSEDGRGPSIWDTFAHTPGRIADGETGDVADDHYHRYAEDIRLLADLGLKAYRFSIAWPRVIPTGSGAPNPAGLDFYRRLAETCLENGVTPYATLYHWDLPQPLEDAGGWLVRDTAERFRDYAAITHSALSDVVKHWMTLNEPWCSAFLGYGNGEHAPGRTEGADALKAVHHLMLGHGLALQAISSPETTVGIALNPAPVHAASESEADRDAARRADGLRNRMFLDPLLLGKYPADVLEDTGMTEWFAQYDADLLVISAPLDFIGVNYYCPQTVAAPDGPISAPGTPSTLPGSENLVTVDTGLEKTQMGWPIEPGGLRDTLKMINDLAPALPLYVTENGSAYPDEVTADGRIEDAERQQYLEQHLEVTRQVVEEGLPLKGYFAWTLIDNFEWSWGFSRRFGLIHVDYSTQERKLKNSALWLRDFLKS